MRLTRTKSLALGVIGIALLLWLGWTAFAGSFGSGESQVRGLVTNVEAANIGHARSIALRTERGEELRFQVAPEVDMTPGHLREHMTFGQPVTVRYRRAEGTLVAVEITD